MRLKCVILDLICVRVCAQKLSRVPEQRKLSVRIQARIRVGRLKKHEYLQQAQHQLLLLVSTAN